MDLIKNYFGLKFIIFFFYFKSYWLLRVSDYYLVVN